MYEVKKKAQTAENWTPLFKPADPSTGQVGFFSLGCW